MLLPQMEQRLLDPGSIRTTKPLTFLATHEMMMRVCEQDHPFLPPHQKSFKPYLYLGCFKHAGELNGNYYCSFKAFISLQWCSETHRINKFLATTIYPSQKCFSKCAKPPYYRISVFDSVICNVYVNGTECTNLFTTISLPSKVIVSTCRSGDDDLRSPTFGFKNRLYYL